MNVTASILCPGPSLAGYTQRPPDDDERQIVIAVNRGVLAGPADWLVALDAHTIGMMEDIPRVGWLLTGIAAWAEIETCFPAFAARVEHVPKAWLRTAWLPRANTFLGHSFLVAIILAAHLGADRIECWGADFGGVADFDGYTSPRQKRDAGRWRCERELYDELVRQLSLRGHCVCRIGNALAPEVKIA